MMIETNNCHSLAAPLPDASNLENREASAAADLEIREPEPEPEAAVRGAPLSISPWYGSRHRYTNINH